MRIEINKNSAVDVDDVIARSPVKGKPDAHALLCAYLMTSNEIWVGKADDKIACVCGLTTPSLLSERAYLWMLHTDVVEEHQFLFVRHSQIWINDLLKKYRSIHGHCEVGNERGIRWLKWLGAMFEPVEDGMVQFQIRRKHG